MNENYELMNTENCDYVVDLPPVAKKESGHGKYVALGALGGAAIGIGGIAAYLKLTRKKRNIAMFKEFLAWQEAMAAEQEVKAEK